MAQYVAVQGDFERVILLQSTIETAFDYFTDFNFVLPRLPEIDRVMRYADGRYRMVFGADDGRGHEMGIVFDIRHELTDNRHIKIVSLPLSEEELHKDPRMNQNNGPLFPGRFSGETLFRERGQQIEVIYRARLAIEIEVPRFLSFMPRRVLQQIGDTMMNVKLHNVADGLAERLGSEFSDWCEANQVRLPVAAGARNGAASPVRVVDSKIQRPPNETN